VNQARVFDQPNNERVKRPTAITIIRILGFTGVVLSIPMISPEISALASLPPQQATNS
tara:strand:+ start:4581 stop:4754 length:174 start_codon:yes stop_codon:yes gene_type:complete